MIINNAVWTWFNDSRAIFLNQNTILIGYVRGDGQPGLTKLDVQNQNMVDINLGTPSSTERDDHNNPAISVLNDRRILLVYSRHGTDESFFYRISKNQNPQTIDDWGEEKSVERGARTTYANLVNLKKLPGKTLNFHRCINWNPTLSVYYQDADRWGDPLPFIKSGVGKVRPYFKLTSDGIGRIHFIYTDHHPNNFDNSVYHLYFSEDKCFDSFGGLLGRLEDGPLNHDEGQRGSLVYKFNNEKLGIDHSLHHWIPGGRAWVWDISLTKDHVPVCVFSVCKRSKNNNHWDDDRIFYYWAILTKNGWEKRCIASAGRPLYEKERDYAAGICLDKNNPYKVYLCSNAMFPFKVDFNDDALNSSDLSSSYSMFDLVLNEKLDIVSTSLLSSSNAFRPYSISSDGGRSALLWLSGSYESYRSYKTDIKIKIFD
jgi:hypothetical protein